MNKDIENETRTTDENNTQQQEKTTQVKKFIQSYLEKKELN